MKRTKRVPGSACLFYIAVVLLLDPALCGVHAADKPITWWTTHALEKIRPMDSIPDDLTHSIELWAARNEFEPFQIVLRTEGQDLTGVDIEVTDLAGPKGTIPAKTNVTIFFETYINLKAPSSIEGAAGDWPDPLIPRIDRFTGEKRNAFPMRLAAGRNQTVWIDVYVPLSTPPGEYTGSVLITLDGAVYAAAPLTLHVWSFALPSTSSLKTSFGFNGVAALKQHFGKYTNDRDILRLVQTYQKSALLHRISIHGGSMIPPRIASGGTDIDWSAYDNEIGPFLDGTVFTGNDPLPGAKATTADLRLPPELTDEQNLPYYRQWIQHFREKGWLERLFHYLRDEPRVETYRNVAAKGRAAHRADPAVRNLVTVALNRELQGAVDIWVPLINCFGRKPGFPPFCEQSAPREAYGRELASGKGLWWYQSCASHGCNIIGDEYFRGWPSYMIDASPVAGRIFQWLAWKYGIEGELYFSMNEAFGRAGDPWDSVSLFGGNGDGTLFYPGRPARIGGASDIPIESIRLKLIREGLEDYEYLYLCSRLGLTELAGSSSKRIASHIYQWDHSPETLYALRRKMGDALSEQYASGVAPQAVKTTNKTISPAR